MKNAVILLPLLIAAVLALLARTMAPIKRGSAEELWENACHFHEWEKAIGGHGHFYKPREGYFLYDIHDLHHSELYEVPEDEVSAFFGQVINQLQDEENPYIFKHARAGFEKWNSRNEPDLRNPETLLADIRDAHLIKNKVENPGMNSCPCYS